MKLRKTIQGNYKCWHKGYYLFFFKRLHGGWCCIIRKNKVLWSLNGFHAKSMKNISDAKKWANEVIESNHSISDWKKPM